MKIRVWRTRPLSRRRVPGLPTRWAGEENGTCQPAPALVEDPHPHISYTSLEGLCCEDFSLFDAGLQLLRRMIMDRGRVWRGLPSKARLSALDLISAQLGGMNLASDTLEIFLHLPGTYGI